MNHIFSLSDNPLPYCVTVRASGEFIDREQLFEKIYEWFSSTLRGNYHINQAELPIVVYSFSDDTDAVEFKLRFG